MTNTISRRNLLAGTGAAALFTLTHSAFDGDDVLAATDPLGRGPLTVGDPALGRLDINNVAPWTAPPDDIFQAQHWASGVVALDNTGTYADGFNPVKLTSGDYIATTTVNDTHEGGGDRTHTVILRSTDGGDTWQQTGVMEPPEAPEAAYGTPWQHPSGRLYVFYQYNNDNIRAIPGNPTGRVDCVGVIAYRSSTDDGRTWSDRRHFDIPVTDIDRRNQFAGAQTWFWMGPGPPVTHGVDGYIGISKGGIYLNDPMQDTEGVIVKFTETAPGQLAATFSTPINCGEPATEEPCPVIFDDGVINCTFRTTVGKVGEAWSTDGGQSWATDWAHDRTGATIAQPRALIHQIRLPDGRYFLWHHNSRPDGAEFFPRNPAFYRTGERDGNRIIWGAPKLLLWDDDPKVQMSGPSFMFDDTTMTLSATNKQTARMFRFPLAGL